MEGLELADPNFLAADPVEFLLDADVCALILEPSLRNSGVQEPVAQQTTLGWIISGTAGEGASPRFLTHHCQVGDDLSALVRGFWQQEELPDQSSSLLLEDKECEKRYVRTLSRNLDGRYVVRLPVVDPMPDLQDSRRSSVRVFSHLESKFSRDPELHQLYVQFMREYKELSHMSPVVEEDASVGRVNYFPHHGVMR